MSGQIRPPHPDSFFVIEETAPKAVKALKLDYEDPFGLQKPAKRTTIPSQKVKKTSQQKRIAEKVTQPGKVKTIDWSRFNFNGISQQGNHSYVVLKVDHHHYYMKAGDSLGEIKLQRLFRDSLWLSVGDSMKTLYLD